MGAERRRRKVGGTEWTGKVAGCRKTSRHGLIGPHLSPGFWDFSGSPEVKVEARNFHFLSQLETERRPMYFYPDHLGKGKD